MSDDIKNTVKEMARLVVNSNKISEMHEKNMKMYPLIFFENVSEVKIEYDLSHQSDVKVDKDNNITVKSPIRHCYVSYYLTIEEDKNTNLQRRFDTLEASIRTLFWKDVKVNIFFNDKKVFESKK